MDISEKNITTREKHAYTEYIAFDVTELYRRKKELEKSNAEQREIMNRLTNIARNVVSITREEEILSLKMKIHNDLGFSLQSTRQFFAQGCPEGKKEIYVAEQRKMAKVLLGEVGNDDEINVYVELEKIAGRDKPKAWEERNGELWYDSGIEGEILGEKTDSWVKAIDQDGYFTIFTSRFLKS